MSVGTGQSALQIKMNCSPLQRSVWFMSAFVLKVVIRTGPWVSGNLFMPYIHSEKPECP